MKQILITMILVSFFSGCQDNKEEQAQHDVKIAQEARAQLLKEQAEAKEKQEALDKKHKYSKIGISTEEGIITIDTNKTKHYFKDLAHQMKTKMDKISKDLEKGIIQNKEAGIEMDETHINIDLNKTKTFLDIWAKKMQGFVKEFDTMSKDFKITKDINATH